MKKHPPIKTGCHPHRRYVRIGKVHPQTDIGFASFVQGMVSGVSAGRSFKFSSGKALSIGLAMLAVLMAAPVYSQSVPAFITQPASQSVLAGSNVTFTATVDGTPPYSYQWNFNGSPLAYDPRISGSATESLSISNLIAADAGNYTVTVTNVSGATNSAAAVLTVLLPPGITLNPVGRSVPPGLPTTFNASASGVPAPDFQWQLNGTNIPGATRANYTNAAVGPGDLGFYHLVASNAVGVTVSADAQLAFGPVAAWGSNFSNESLPPPGLSNVFAVAGSFGASFAVRTDGNIVAWGGGTATNIPASASNVVAISSSGGTVVLRNDGTMVGWNSTFAPPAASNITAVAAGYDFGLALRADGTLVAWGGSPF
ncbi:MAG: immunoglobulin domain-containing protein, partial [Verrucomicrobiota bacterium]